MSAHGVDRTGAASGSGAALNPIDQTMIDAKGDLIAGTAADAAARLAVGANDTVLVADSTQTTGLKWLAAVLSSLFTTKGDIVTASAASTFARKGVGTDGYRLQAQSGASDGLQYLPPDLGYSLLNGYLEWSVAASALTVAIKTWAGTDPSTTDPVYALVRSATTTTGLPTLVKITAANSVVVSSGSTLGTRSAIPCRVWAVLFDDAGTYRLGVINCLTTVAGAGAGSDVTAIFPLAGWGIASSTAEGGAGAADSAQTFYTGTAVAAKAYATIGYATFESGQATAGTWATAASRKQLWERGSPLPGTAIQTQRNQTGAVGSGATTVPNDDTIPQSGEGVQFMTQAITPNSAANALVVEASAVLSADTAADELISSVFQDATANALASMMFTHNTNYKHAHRYTLQYLAATTSSTTFKLRAGCSTQAVTFNGQATARKLGGAMFSYMSVTEIMA